ncbi:helix-turn-helix domain-containing protein [Fulvivirgaceae bacterium BMA10]|uniref:Helix-turn-helix domain-containing protein n=1 Tax=Splendidivirga corallicola TaxID=3051826 RepID=A0ABT8KSK3_9BACT|nr:helix-turn-helix domain-containing protein [Fulvivirgaceae bacterium BMA10]
MPTKYFEIPPNQELTPVIKNSFVYEYDEDIVRSDYFLPSGMAYLFYMQAEEDFNTQFLGMDENLLITNGLYVSYMNTLAEYTHKKIRSVGMAIFPIYLEALFKDGPNRFVNRCLRIEESESFSLDGFREMSNEEILKKFETFILQQLKKNPINEEVYLVYKKVTEIKKYNSSIEELSKMTGCSTRHLNNLFRKSLGMSPKRFIQLVRFNHGIQLIKERGEYKNLTYIAHELGYHDQAHFIKDFRKLCYKTPGELLDDTESVSGKFKLY